MKITWIDSQEMFVQQSLKNKLYLLFKIEVFCPNGCSKDHNRQMAAFILFLSKCTWLLARTVSDVAHLTWSFPPLTQTPIHALISLKQSLSAQLQQPVIEQDCGHFLSEIYNTALQTAVLLWGLEGGDKRAVLPGLFGSFWRSELTTSECASSSREGQRNVARFGRG